MAPTEKLPGLEDGGDEGVLVLVVTVAYHFDADVHVDEGEGGGAQKQAAVADEYCRSVRSQLKCEARKDEAEVVQTLAQTWPFHSEEELLAEDVVESETEASVFLHRN